MTEASARQILSSLLAEKDIQLRDDADIRHVLALTLSTEDLPDELGRALAETFNAVAHATHSPARDNGAAKPDGSFPHA